MADNTDGTITRIQYGGLPEVDAYATGVITIHTDIAATRVHTGNVITRNVVVKRYGGARRNCCSTRWVAIGICCRSTTKNQITTARRLIRGAIGRVKCQIIVFKVNATTAGAIGITPEHQTAVVCLECQGIGTRRDLTQRLNQDF